jgi:Fur family transcriptional regulator, zinc uptake regulator
VATSDFSPQTDVLLDRADRYCVRRGSRLTSLRRQVLGFVLESPKPTGAYDLLDRLRVHHKGAAPPTVYRALEFLLEQGLIHKVERLSAFVGCVHGIEGDPEPASHGDHAHAHADMHAVQFLICKRCQRVTELNDAEIGQSLLRAARETGFSLSSATVEADGVCAACAAAAAVGVPVPTLQRDGN